MTEPVTSDRRTTGTAPLGIAIVVGSLVLGLVGWVIFAEYRSSRVASAIVVRGPTLAQEWADHVRAGRLDKAYAATTSAFRARVDRAAFGRWVSDHPELKLTPEPRGLSVSKSTQALTIGLNGIRIIDTPPRVTHKTGFRPAGEGAKVLRIVVAAEGERPLVDQAEIEPESPTKP
jgi:hypothetical protein